MKYIQRSMLIALIALAGCAKELPPDQKDFVGLWKNDQMTLLITAGGGLEYERKSEGDMGSTSKSISAPIKKIGDGKITAGVLFFSTDFKIDRPPKEEKGVWSMVIDGQELFKADEHGRMPQAQAAPNLEKVRELIVTDLRLLNKGFQTNDFSEYLQNSSLTFQSQFDNAKLQETYKAFVDAKVDLESLMTGDFVLIEEPSITPEGVLKISGFYQPDAQTRLQVGGSYVYAHPQWKSLGFNIKVGQK